MLKPIQRSAFLLLIAALTAERGCNKSKVSNPTVIKSGPLNKNDGPLNKNDEKSEAEHKLLTHTENKNKKDQHHAAAGPVLSSSSEFKSSSELKDKKKETVLQTAIVHEIQVPNITQDKKEAQAVTDSQLVFGEPINGNTNIHETKNEIYNKIEKEGRENENKNEGKSERRNEEKNNAPDGQAQAIPSKENKNKASLFNPRRWFKNHKNTKNK
ncbi:hypothetical protein [Candidatus Cardinium hertigii]|jgi:hypothetical protein|uniref:Uncharacterized protein n=1 Tax=Candidatus Cardinium hertigii TaxID=247481 RepID=A0A3N2QAX7_9BACT|nr:hypothetical protein [Candidatus Cardinium hertigii]ROT46957.1 hypothetical protein EDM02_05265 [Candidatus Cardinium hertigii]